MNTGIFSESSLSRVEDASINASAPPQQRWVDGWLLRYGPGKARRARCVQAVADGCLPLDARLALCADVFDAAGLPMIVRITPFSRPLGLDAALAQRGFRAEDTTQVMVMRLGDVGGMQGGTSRGATRQVGTMAPLLERLAPADFAEAVGQMRESPPDQRAGHTERLLHSPVPHQGWVLRRPDDGVVLACAQIATESDMVGLYDVFTHADSRGQGLATSLCASLLAQAQAAGASVAYLQVLASNEPARAVYLRLGFADAYAYHYRTLAPSTA